MIKINYKNKLIFFSLLILTISLLFVICFCGCSKEGKPIEIVLDKTSIDVAYDNKLPNISLKDEYGRITKCDYTDFYYESKSLLCYVFDGNVKETDCSPTKFNDKLTIIHKNSGLKTELSITKSYVELNDFSFEIINYSQKLYVGVEYSYNVKFFPQNASNNNYEITTTNDKITINKNNRTIKIEDDYDVSKSLNLSITSAVKNIDISFEIAPKIMISTVVDLLAIKDNPYGSYILTNNIDLSTISNWINIPYFFGKIDGQNYTISYMNKTLINIYLKQDINVGFVNNLEGEIEDLIFDKCYFSTDKDYHSQSTFKLYVGIIAGYNNGLITGCAVSDSKLSILCNNSAIGAVAGLNIKEINDCEVNGCLFGESGDIGGIVGCNKLENTNKYNKNVYNCRAKNCFFSIYNIHNIRAVGGLIGYNSGFCEESSVANNTFLYLGYDNDISGTISPIVGELVGKNHEGYIWHVNCKKPHTFEYLKTKPYLEHKIDKSRLFQGPWGVYGFNECLGMHHIK